MYNVLFVEVFKSDEYLSDDHCRLNVMKLSFLELEKREQIACGDKILKDITVIISIYISCSTLIQHIHCIWGLDNPFYANNVGLRYVSNGRIKRGIDSLHAGYALRFQLRDDNARPSVQGTSSSAYLHSIS